MLTITNNLQTHLVVPHGVAEGISLKVPPKGQVQVERVTAALKDAEKRGHLTVGYPSEAVNGERNAAGQKVPKKPTAQSPLPTAEPEETT